MIHHLVKLTPLVLLLKEVRALYSMVVPSKKPQKIVNDNHRFTDYHKSVIRAEYEAAQLFNSLNTNQITHQALADKLNAKFGFNKSVRAYSRVWSQRGKP